MIQDVDDITGMVRAACNTFDIRTGKYMKQSVSKLLALGLNAEELYACVIITARATHVERSGQWPYFLAVARNKAQQELDGDWAYRVIESVS